VATGFDYLTPFEREDPDAVARFQRSFEHDDWIDGVSTIQAERNGAEQGFNARFHRIEQDLDMLGKDGRLSLESLAQIRRDLFDRMNEIRDELRRIEQPHGDRWETVPALPAGWTVMATTDGVPFNPPGYFLDRSGMVQLRGALTSTIPPTDAGTTLFTLKPDFRPENKILLGVYSGTATARVEILRTGAVVVKPPFGGFISLDGAQFRAQPSAA
jgi:hypothetical protein